MKTFFQEKKPFQYELFDEGCEIRMYELSAHLGTSGTAEVEDYRLAQIKALVKNEPEPLVIFSCTSFEPEDIDPSCFDWGEVAFNDLDEYRSRTETFEYSNYEYDRETETLWHVEATDEDYVYRQIVYAVRVIKKAGYPPQSEAIAA